MWLANHHLIKEIARIPKLGPFKNCASFCLLNKWTPSPSNFWQQLLGLCQLLAYSDRPPMSAGVSFWQPSSPKVLTSFLNGPLSSKCIRLQGTGGGGLFPINWKPLITTAKRLPREASWKCQQFPLGEAPQSMFWLLAKYASNYHGIKITVQLILSLHAICTAQCTPSTSFLRENKEGKSAHWVYCAWRERI